MTVMSIFATQPEALKLAPVIRAFETEGRVEHITYVTGQHREMLDQVVGLFGNGGSPYRDGNAARRIMQPG